jgi:hypothetical protein
LSLLKNSAHTGIAAMMKVDETITEALRNETPLVNPKLEALRTMTLSIVRNRGHVVEEELAAFTQQVMVSNKFWK